MIKRRTITILRRIRRARKLSRYLVAQETGIPYSTLRYLESGVSSRVDLQHILLLSDYYEHDFTARELLA